MAKTDQILMVREAWATEVDGVPRMIRVGETFRAGHPLLHGNEHRLRPFEITYDHERDAAAAAATPAPTTRARATATAGA